MDVIYAILGFIFFDCFLITFIVSIVAASVILLRRYSSVNLPDALVDGCRKGLVTTAAIVGGFLLIGFFMYGEGIDRLAIVPLILGASPLFLGALIAYVFSIKKW